MQDALFDEDGSLHLGRAQLVAYAHGEYFPLEKQPQGFFGYSVAREEVLRRRLGGKESRSKPRDRNKHRS